MQGRSMGELKCADRASGEWLEKEETLASEEHEREKRVPKKG
jgi:hypothetical protein